MTCPGGSLKCSRASFVRGIKSSKKNHSEVNTVSELLVAEERRLEQSRVAETPWKKWGPYLTERQWGTVREDYSENGNAWDYFSHDQARSRAYRWGEDGLAGISEDQQFLCFALALWNGKDPLLKERLFGLTTARETTARTSKNITSTSTARRRIPT